MQFIPTKTYKVTIIIVIIFLFLLPSKNSCNGAPASFEAGVNYLSQYIASEKFNTLKLGHTDLELIDTLYIKAVKFYNGDISEALLALTFATLPFNKMPVTIPFTRIVLKLKLPSVNEELFIKKRNNLPGLVYFNSPTKGGKDKDKVAHFFSNAFLSYNITIVNASKFLGIFVELFEAAFKVSGGVDKRDLYTNYLGEYFGESLRKNKGLFPSDFFKIYSLFFFSYTW